ncbi:FRG domain-containing protein [Photobacterium sanguinicancri]|uniref:FRG domain-containing protein n=1 Tax=Photobacterium sanguinicancri TaxID=875932 RepID=UPI003D0A4EF9
MSITWKEYKEIVNDDLLRNKPIYRGQSNSSWPLVTSLHRTGLTNNASDLSVYFNQILPSVQEQVEAWDGTRRNLTEPNDMGQFLGFLQHNGFPTPLLDWTFSPYIAAYFAFEGVNHFKPDSDFVSIYRFDQAAWLSTFQQTYDYNEEKSHVTLLKPTYRGNHKQMLQQGLFTFTNCIDIGQHVKLNETDDRKFLEKFDISVKERDVVIRDLELMGVTMMQLSPSVESVCKKAFMSLSSLLPVGPSPSDRVESSESKAEANC